MYSNVTVIGRLTADPELRQTNNGIPVTNFSLAVDRNFKDSTADFFDVTAWRERAELISAYKKKGDLVAIQGHLQQERWEQDGQKRSKVSIVANQVVFMPGNKDDSSNSNSGGNDDEDIPF